MTEFRTSAYAALLPLGALLAIAFVAGLALPAAAQRSVPVHVDNAWSEPIPVALVGSGPGGGAVSSLSYAVCIQSLAGPGAGPEFAGCLEAEALGLSVGRPLTETGEKGGTADINIGVGELAPVVLHRIPDGASAALFRYGINGNSMGLTEIHVLEQRDGWTKPLPTMEVRLGRSFVQSLELDPASRMETLRLYYNQIEWTTYQRDANGTVTFSAEHCWDTVTQTGSCDL